MPPPLRRALAAAISQLKEARPETAAQVLSQLVAPAREAGGAEAGDALAQAARAARAGRVRAGALAWRADGTEVSLEGWSRGSTPTSDGTAAPETVPTGFPSLDRVLGGGVPPAGPDRAGRRRREREVGARARDRDPGGAGGHRPRSISPARWVRSACSSVRWPSRAEFRSMICGRAGSTPRRARPSAPRRSGCGIFRWLLRPLLGASFEEVVASLDRCPAGRCSWWIRCSSRHRRCRPSTLDERVALAVRALKALAVERNLAVLALAQLPAHRGRSSRPAPHARRLRRARRDQAERGCGAGDLSGGDVPAGPGRGRRDGAHRRQEPQRADRVRGSVLLSADPAVRGHAGSGCVTSAVSLRRRLRCRAVGLAHHRTRQARPASRCRSPAGSAPRAAGRSGRRGAPSRPPHPSPRSPASSSPVLNTSAIVRPPPSSGAAGERTMTWSASGARGPARRSSDCGGSGRLGRASADLGRLGGLVAAGGERQAEHAGREFWWGS